MEKCPHFTTGIGEQHRNPQLGQVHCIFAITTEHDLLFDANLRLSDPQNKTRHQNLWSKPQKRRSPKRAAVTCNKVNLQPGAANPWFQLIHILTFPTFLKMSVCAHRMLSSCLSELSLIMCAHRMISSFWASWQCCLTLLSIASFLTACTTSQQNHVTHMFSLFFALVQYSLRIVNARAAQGIRRNADANVKKSGSPTLLLANHRRHSHHNLHASEPSRSRHTPTVAIWKQQRMYKKRF